ncbi:MAG TPA: DUF4252 domain-containing protein [Pyrinomonadaceae bacterium]|nr:DUF4252 domain-containing protein [Pyrinomonadaceae bacterium]
MKSFFQAFSKLAAAGIIAALAAGAAAAQAAAPSKGRLRLDNLDRLAPKAAETVNVDIDGGLITFGCKLLSDEDPEEKQVKEMCAGLKGVYVRGFEFEAAGQYAESDVEAVRAQLRGPGWSRLVDVETRGDGMEGAEVYAATEAGRVEGMAILFFDPKQLTVINIVGSVDLDKLRRLEGVLNLPKIRIERKRRPPDKTDPPAAKPNRER